MQLQLAGAVMSRRQPAFEAWICAVAQALQLESGQNTELRDDLTALSTELHRLQTEQAATQQAQASSPSPPESSPSLAEGPAAFPVAEHSASDGQVSSAALQEVEALTLQLDEANAAAASASTMAAEAAAKSRADMKVRGLHTVPSILDLSCVQLCIHVTSGL